MKNTKNNLQISKQEKLKKQKLLGQFLAEQVLEHQAKNKVEDLARRTQHELLLKNVKSMENAQLQKHKKYLSKLEEMYKYNYDKIQSPEKITMFIRKQKSLEKQEVERDVRAYNNKQYEQLTQKLHKIMAVKEQDRQQALAKRRDAQLQKQYDKI